MLLPCQGQDWDNYQPIQAEGKLPKDLLLSARQFVREENRRMGQADDKYRQRNQERFLLESSYHIQDLLRSGRVLFRDPLTDYVNEVARHLLRDSVALRQRLRFYVVRSHVANAFATNSGIIFVNTGLLARLEDEAQLAFILSHEISHFIAQHPIHLYQQTQNIQKRKLFYQRAPRPEEVLTAKNNYSREMEEEADLLGLQLYLQSDYALSSAESTFDVLQNARGPFAERLFEKQLWESELLQFATETLLDSLAQPEDPLLEENPAEQTHPSPALRKELFADAIKDLKHEGRERWHFNQEKFERIKKICQFESCHMMLLDQEYEQAFYNAYALQTAEPQSKYLKKIMGQALYAINKYSNEGRFWDVHQDYAEATGNFQQFLHFIEALDDTERNLMTFRYLWDMYKATPGDKELALMATDLLEEIVELYAQETDYFKPMPEDLPVEPGVYTYALSDYWADSLFEKKLISSYMNAEIKRSKRLISRKQKRNKITEQNRLQLRGFNLGLDKVVFVDPGYDRLDMRKKQARQYKQAQQGKKRYIRKLSEYATQLDLEHHILSSHQLETDDLEIFNDLRNLHDWIEEKNTYQELDMVNVSQGEVQYLIEKYGTPYFVWTRALSITRRRPASYLFLPENKTFFYTMVYNIETGKYKVLYPRLLQMKEDEDVFNSVVYDMVFQIKTPHK